MVANYHGLNAVASTKIRPRCGVQAAVLPYPEILLVANYHGLNAVAYREIRPRCGVQAAVLPNHETLSVKPYHGLNAVACPHAAPVDRRGVGAVQYLAGRSLA